MKRLSEAKEGEEVKVLEIVGGNAVLSKLLRLGVVPGTEMRIVRNSYGPIIAEVRKIQVAFGRGIAEKIIVEEIEKKENNT
ncbi:MAG: FeoA domain-containing protein [Fervidicoccaceae archaeon]